MKVASETQNLPTRLTGSRLAMKDQGPLHPNEEKYKDILENSEEGYFEVDLAGNLSFFNKALCRITGYSREELLGMNNRKYTRPETARKLYEVFNQVYRTGRSAKSSDYEILRKDGSSCFLEISAYLFSGSDGLPRGFRGMVRDVTERKLSLKALEESEARYRLLADHATDMIFTMNLELEFLYVSPSVQRIMGYDADFFISLPLDRLLTPPSLESARQALDQELSREGKDSPDPLRVITLELEARHREGSTIWLEGRMTFLRHPDGSPQGVLGVARDISDRKMAEAALRESESKYRQLVKHAPAGIYEVDFINRKFLMVNDVMCEYTGYTKEEFLSLSPMDILTEESVERFLERMSKVFAGEPVPETVEFQIRGKDGRNFWVVLYTRYSYENGMPKGATVVVHDITERRNAEEALRKSEEKYRLLVEHAEEGVFIDQEGAIQFPNPKAMQILGYSQEELTGLRFVDLIHPHDRKRLQAARPEDGGAPKDSTTLRLINKGGNELWLEVKAVPILWDGSPALLHLLRDVTRQKTLEAQLMHVQKMEAIGTLAGGIAHNFNNLLMGIQGNISLMLMDADSSRSHTERLGTIEKLIESGSKLTGQLLGYARGGKYEARPMDLNRLVQETSQTFGLAKKEIAIHLDLSEHLWHVAADRAQIEEVLMNLFVNAADAMPRGGDLFLTTRNVTEQALQGKPFKVEPGLYALVRVRDTGSGMDAAILDRIFDPFFTTKPVGRGTGLGLASAYGILKAHNGYIDVESEKGAGTCFFLYLPASNHQVVQEEPLRSGPVRGAETLLVVDDEESVLKVAQLMLEKLGYRVLAARSAKEAIQVFNGSRECIHMVILDMIMPDMGGGTLYERLKAIDPGLKALLSSGYSLDGQATEILRQGCNGFIQKPFGVVDLSRKIREILDRPMRPS
ncbi:MAG: PAS domain S-box protein [Desulfobacterota bacterium]|nr:PAS domain S-box protein [Thermodesulfobacteriota bacterium]